MDVKPFVSVLMSAYNEEDWVGKSIDSVLEQTYDHFEFVIVDDGSTDSTPKILDSYAQRDKRIKVIHQENTGLTRALNIGLDKCQGEFIARMDANDICLPERFQRQVAFLQSHPDHAAVGTWREEFWPSGKTKVQKLPASHEEIADVMVRYCPLGHSTSMIRGDILRDFRYNEEFVTSQDYELWARLIEKFKLANIPEVLMRISRIEGSVTHSKPKWRTFKLDMRIKWLALRNTGFSLWKLRYFLLPFIKLIIPRQLVRVLVRWRDS